MVLVVTYHALAAARSPVTVTTAELTRDLRGLRDAGYAFVSLDACADWLHGRTTLPQRAAAITFDDGYASVAEEGLAVLAEAQVQATVFVIAGLVGRDNAWPGQGARVPPMPLADWRQLRALIEAGHALGAHSWSHTRLTSLPASDLQREIVEAGDRLEQVTGAAVRYYAYPYGAFGARESTVVATRYAGAVTTRVAPLTRNTRPVAIPRIDAHDLRLALSLGIARSPSLGPYLAIRRMARAARQGAWASIAQS